MNSNTSDALERTCSICRFKSAFFPSLWIHMDTHKIKNTLVNFLALYGGVTDVRKFEGYKR